MSSVTIRHLRTRLRVAAGAEHAVDDPARLKRLLAEMIERALEPALQRCGVDGRGEICIRRVVALPLRLDMAAPDGALIERWADAWAETITRRIGERDAEVQRYASHAQALIDLSVSAMAGDFSRAWAWRQLGLWTEDEALTPGDAAGLVMRALIARPAAAPAAVARLAERPQAFERWSRWAGASALQALAQAVLGDAGAAPDALRGVALHEAGAAVRATAGRVQRRSVIARAAAAQEARPAQARALAVLAVAEAEPAWLRAPGLELGALLEGVAAGIAAGGAGSAAARLSAGDPAHDTPPHRPTASPATNEAEGEPSTPLQRPNEAPAGSVQARAVHADASELPPQPAAAHPSAAMSHTARAALSTAPDTALPATAEALEPLADGRRRGRTCHAGLLFLLNLAAPLCWPERLLQHPVLAGRGPRWTLHRLALQLLPLQRDDPAALAFAGLRPGDEPPDSDQAPADADDIAAVDALGHELLALLCARLKDEGATATELLARVCARDAEIVADPGWLEVHLALDGVSTAVRVAGLDLDPGWVPWLGLVIRFVYGARR